MAEFFNVRVTQEDREAIERVRMMLGARSGSAAIRELVHRADLGAKSLSVATRNRPAYGSLLKGAK